MKIKKQLPKPLTARLDNPFQFNNPQKLNSLSRDHHNLVNKKYTHDDCMNSIGPWAVDEFNISKNGKFYKFLQSSSKSKAKHHKKNYMGSDQKAKYRYETECLPVDEEICKKKERIQTESPLTSVAVRVNTIQLSENIQSSTSKKYFSQDQKRKMSMHKIRESCIQAKPNNLLGFKQTKQMIQKKINEKILQNGGSIAKRWIQNQTTKRLKTIQSQNTLPLVFFFQAKNNNNMMSRQKNIMKIRNLIGKKTRRLHTDGLS